MLPITDIEGHRAIRYRVRRQAFTGKLIVQHRGFYGWIDGDTVPDPRLAIVPETYLAELEERVAKYENRAAGQRNARARRAAPTPLPSITETP